MGEVIIPGGEDEPDLCKKRKKDAIRIPKRIAVLLYLIVLGCLLIIAQHTDSLFAWQEYRAFADEGVQAETVCLLKQDLRNSLERDTRKISLAEDVCGTQLAGIASVSNEYEQFEQELMSIVIGYPIAEMVPAIAKQNRTVAAFLIGIAKKESDWGKHVPTQNGQDCFNYWGYKGAGGRGSAMGYACFETPEEAVSVVGGRLSHFVLDTKRDTPSEMLVWKCGSSCAAHDPKGVQSWVANVDLYFQKIVKQNRG